MAGNASEDRRIDEGQPKKPGRVRSTGDGPRCVEAGVGSRGEEISKANECGRQKLYTIAIAATFVLFLSVINNLVFLHFSHF